MVPTTTANAPVPLIPLEPVRQVRRDRVVCGGEGKMKEVLQPVLDAVKDSTKDEGKLVAAPAPTYVLDRVLTNQPGTGSRLYIAYTSQGRGGGPASASAASGDPVIIKAMPQPAKDNDPAAATNKFLDPFTDIAAHQLLMLHQAGQSPHSSHVIPLLDAMQDQDFVYLVLPYMTNEDLFAKVEGSKQGGLEEEEVRGYLRQIVKGLLFMKHTSGLAHCDLSLENIMLDKEGTIQIIDLGLCTRVAQAVGGKGPSGGRQQPVFMPPDHYCGKGGYVCPEFARFLHHCDPFAADVWSLGVCVYVMLTGRLLYQSPADEQFSILEEGGAHAVIDHEIRRHGLTPLSPAAKDLICRMLHPDPIKRPTLEELQRHPFLREGKKRSSRPLASRISQALSKLTRPCRADTPE